MLGQVGRFSVPPGLVIDQLDVAMLGRAGRFPTPPGLVIDQLDVAMLGRAGRFSAPPELVIDQLDVAMLGRRLATLMDRVARQGGLFLEWASEALGEGERRGSGELPEDNSSSAGRSTSSGATIGIGRRKWAGRFS